MEINLFGKNFDTRKTLKRDILFTWIISIISIFILFGLSLIIPNILGYIFNWQGWENLGKSFFYFFNILFCGFYVISIYAIIKTKLIIKKWFNNNNKLFISILIVSIISYFILGYLFNAKTLHNIYNLAQRGYFDTVCNRLIDVFEFSSPILLISILIIMTIILLIKKNK